jgi:hypothetical protein
MTGGVTASAGTSDDLVELWSRFAASGRVDNTSIIRDGTTSAKWFVANNTDLPAHNLPNPSPMLPQNITNLAAIATCEAACLKIGVSCQGFVFVTTAVEANPRCAFKSSTSIQPISRPGTIAVTKSAPPQPAPAPAPPTPPVPVPTGMSNPDGHGAIALSGTVPASGSLSLSIVMSWR